MKRVLDVCCGGKLMYFDKQNPDVEFCDIREVEKFPYYKNYQFEVKPDTVCDFQALPFDDETYDVVVFDPPHLECAGPKSIMALKYGRLQGDWKTELKNGFQECFRVLKPDGVPVFKWSSVQIPLREILPLAPYEPVFGNKGGRSYNTHWLLFMKPKREEKKNGRN